MVAQVVVIVNPNAQSGGASRRDRETINARLEALPGVTEVAWVLTDSPRHGTILAQTAAEQGARYIFAAGGDGTISEVVNGIMRAAVTPEDRPVFGILPWGTLNDFYMALVDAEQALPPDQITQPLDIGRVQLDDWQAFCCLSISLGLSSWANMQYQQASRRFGRILGAIPAILNTLLTYRRSPGIMLTLDEALPQQRRMLALAIGNCASVGGGVRLTPEARIDDGWFDLSIIKEVPLWTLAYVLAVARLRRHYRLSALEMYRARHIRITSERPVSVHLDGELVPTPDSTLTTLVLDVLPGALQVVRPSRL